MCQLASGGSVYKVDPAKVSAYTTNCPFLKDSLYSLCGLPDVAEPVRLPC